MAHILSHQRAPSSLQHVSLAKRATAKELDRSPQLIEETKQKTSVKESSKSRNRNSGGGKSNSCGNNNDEAYNNKVNMSNIKCEQDSRYSCCCCCPYCKQQGRPLNKDKQVRESSKRSAASTGSRTKSADLRQCCSTGGGGAVAKQQPSTISAQAKRFQQPELAVTQVDSSQKQTESKSMIALEDCRTARCLQQVNNTRECVECRLIARLSQIKTPQHKTKLASSVTKSQLVPPPLPPLPPPMPHVPNSAAQTVAKIARARRVVPSVSSSLSSASATSSPELHDDDISSLTASETNNISKKAQDSWSLSSCADNNDQASKSAEQAKSATSTSSCKQTPVIRIKPLASHFRPPSFRRKTSRLQASAAGQVRRLLARAQRRPAPAPPQASAHSDWSTSSVDSGAELGGHQSADDQLAAQSPGKALLTTKLLEVSSECERSKPNLLSESELFSIEHFMKSHKSSTYVCHCMANLYFTSTRLVNNGRCSKPASEAWQLSKTGVPVLTFDSGLARNRNRRRLSISLAERGSGFILWSDIIDHLSNYRAYCARLHGNLDDARTPLAGSGQPTEADTTCDTFHVMYLSTNHRLMVGLSFDDAHSARLFLRQVELVTADPVNIALTGPKLSGYGATSRRLGPVSRLGRLIRADSTRTREKSAKTGSADRTTPKRARHYLRPSAGEHTWSTLKRTAMQRLRVTITKRPADKSDHPQAGEDSLAETLKPLVELAEAGAKSTGRRAPRKCDISAPCLFQHVTRIDLSNLDSLYSRALVAAGSQGTKLNGPPANRPQPPERLSSSKSESIALSSSVESYPITGHVESAASSCYSSAGSERAHAQQEVSASSARPMPVQATEMVEPRRELSKVRQVIREIEAQGSTELVEAKRRLMADIAGQVMARANLTSMTSHL